MNNNNNKILTVSYGTFSCTLEGFDDSFDTMKAIAEYFRDLAGDDRYFGAEPPQPDADMLARIAEREVSRRVEAHEHEGRIMLKAHEEPVAAVAASVPVMDMPEQSETETPSHLQSDVEEIDVPISDQSEDASNDSDANLSEETSEIAEPQECVAEAEEETLSHETAEVEPISGELPKVVMEETSYFENDDVTAEDTANAETEKLAEEEDTTETEAVEAETSEDGAAQDPIDTLDEFEMVAEDDGQEASEISEEDIPVASEEVSVDLEDAAAFFAESVTADQTDMGTEEELSDEVFASTEALVEDSFDEIEDFQTEEVEEASDDFGNESLADKLQRIRAVVSQRDEDVTETAYDEDTEELAPSHDFEDMASYALSTPAETGAEDAAQALVAEAAQDISDAFEADDAAVEARYNAESDEEDDLEAILRRIETQEELETEEQTVDLSAETSNEEPADNLFASDDDEVDDTEVHGRVLKVDRADLEAALEAGDLQEYDDAELTSASTLSLEDEMDLQGDLSVVEDEDETESATDSTVARETLPNIDTDSGEDVSRLMAEADQQMQEPEGKTRRSAFAHLRAAVAARFADRSMDDADKKVEEKAEVYRSDLAEVVKPRRPVAASNTERPGDARPAPLKLVAEQRIDPEATSPRGPVSPRRVAAADDLDIDQSEGSAFATYAEERGASSLPELLEAAAAYLAYVEGHDQFSRPQLMSHVRQADCGDFSREDGLRSFGQLLRTGKIEKIKGGRFAASEAISFKPDHRAAG